MKRTNKWAIKWRSKNRLNGKREHFIFRDCQPKLFRTRWQARDFIKAEYGYIKDRPDLKAEPHGWKMPIAVKVEIVINEVR